MPDNVPDENQTPNEAGTTPVALPHLTIAPYGVDVFTDFERQREFVTLCYRHKKSGPPVKAFGLLPAVLDDLTRAGLVVTGEVQAQYYPDKSRRVDQEPHYTCHVKVPVRPLADEQRDEREWADAMRTHFGKR